MAIKIVVSNNVGIRVKGTINDADGVAQPFEFVLKCKRLDADQINKKLKVESDATMAEFMEDVVEDWSGVRDEDAKPIPFDANMLKQLFKLPGVPFLAFRAYMDDVGAKAPIQKN